MQAAIFDARMRSTLAADGVDVPTAIPLRPDGDVLKRHEYAALALQQAPSTSDPRWLRQLRPALQEAVSAASARGHSLLLSGESFASVKLRVHEMLGIFSPPFRVHAVLVYRRFFGAHARVHGPCVLTVRSGCRSWAAVSPPQPTAFPRARMWQSGW